MFSTVKQINSFLKQFVMTVSYANKCIISPRQHQHSFKTIQWKYSLLSTLLALFVSCQYYWTLSSTFYPGQELFALVLRIWFRIFKPQENIHFYKAVLRYREFLFNLKPFDNIFLCWCVADGMQWRMIIVYILNCNK